MCRTIFNQFLQSSHLEIRNVKRDDSKRELAGSCVYFIFWLASDSSNVFALMLAFIFTLTLVLLAISLIR